MLGIPKIDLSLWWSPRHSKPGDGPGKFSNVEKKRQQNPPCSTRPSCPSGVFDNTSRMINVATAARGPSRQNHWSTPRRRGGRRDGVHLHAVDARRVALNLGPRRGLADRRGVTIQITARTRSWRACGGVRWRCDVKDALDLFGHQLVSRSRALQQTSRRRRGGRPARPRTGAASMASRSTARFSRRAASMAWRPSRVPTLGRVQAFRESTSDGLVRLKSKRNTHR